MKRVIFTISVLVSLTTGPNAYAVEKWPMGYFKTSTDTSLGETVQTTWVLRSVSGHDSSVDLSSLKFTTQTNSLSENVLRFRVASCGETYRGYKSISKPTWKRVKSLELCEGQENETSAVPNSAFHARNAFATMMIDSKPNLCKPEIDWERGLLTFNNDKGENLAIFEIEAAE